ncbi:MAG TPA: glycosyltransferase [Bryobacteraceae bacterium]|jgi:hypothetical protein|nr:glycosyltransferase [Bryobacteraceae bacterium]
MPLHQTNRLAILVPTYRPSDQLLDFIRQLLASPVSPIIVVDDGSGPEFRELFARLGELPGVEILQHAAPLGEGAAIRTGLNRALCRFPDLIGVVTADPASDSGDVERVAASLLAHPGSLVVPAGQGLMPAIAGSAAGTGVRAIPAALATPVLQIEANGPEFQMELLLAARRMRVPVVEEAVGVTAPRFRPLLESAKLAFLLPRFAAISLLTALLDNLIFIYSLHHGGTLLRSLALGRILALAFNYPAVHGAAFRSRQQHRTVLPAYLLLALAHAAATFAGIGFLGSALAIAVIPAKLIVESSLFLVNFAIQRLFIFTPGPRILSGRRQTPAAFQATVATIFLGALILEVHGFLTSALFSEDVWVPVGIQRFLHYIGMFVAVAFPLLLMVPWTFAGAIVALTAVGTVFAVGPLALLAVAFYCISSCALGSRLLGRTHDDSPESQVFSTLLGATLWILLMTLIARLPVNYPAVWAALLAIPILLDWRGAWRRLERWWRLLRSAELRRYAERAAFAVLVFVLLAHWFTALTPESSADGLAMHLAIPMNIAAHHRMTYQPDRVLWAVMPMGADFSYSIVYLLGGEYAAHLLDFTQLLLICAVLYFAMRRWVCRAAALWLAALFASTPLVQLVTGSLFVENLLAALIAGMAAALWRFSDSGEKRFFFLVAALGGGAMSTKVGAIAFVALALVLLGVEAARHWKSLGPRPAAACTLAAMVLVGLATPPYVIAYVKTGNPLFPFLYNKFPSPLLPRDAGIEELRFKRPLTWETPYDLTFHTNLTYEGRNGSFGFQYLALAPLGLAALLVARRRRDVAAALAIALGAAILIMRTQPNARYLYPALPLLSIPFAALLGWAAGTRWLYRGLMAFVLAAIGLNVRMLPAASYYHRDFYLRQPFSRAEHDRFRDENTPIRAVIDYFNREHPYSAVMLTAESDIAGLKGDFYENHWHQLATMRRLKQIKTLPEMMQQMQTWGVEYFISPAPEFGNPLKPRALNEMLERCTETVYEYRGETLAHLDAECRAPKQRPVTIVKPGSYDDSDPALIFRGDWNNDRSFAEPDNHTISYTDVAGAEVEIDFEGKALTYVYTKAVNRGIASVTVDGIVRGTIDLYSASTQWQSRTRFCCFGPGRHVAIVRATGRQSAQAKGKFIDVDSFVVE